MKTEDYKTIGDALRAAIGTHGDSCADRTSCPATRAFQDALADPCPCRQERDAYSTRCETNEKLWSDLSESLGHPRIPRDIDGMIEEARGLRAELASANAVIELYNLGETLTELTCRGARIVRLEKELAEAVGLLRDFGPTIQSYELLKRQAAFVAAHGGKHE